MQAKQSVSGGGGGGGGKESSLVHQGTLMCVYLALWRFVGYPIVGFFLFLRTKMWDFFFTPAPPSIPQSHQKKTSLKWGIYIYICRVSIQNEEVSAL
jgi:hypothetical protein